jgi:hypothetical protein
MRTALMLFMLVVVSVIHADEPDKGKQAKKPSKGKSITIPELLAREIEQVQQYRTAVAGGNEVEAQKMEKEFKAERLTWNHATISGRATVIDISQHGQGERIVSLVVPRGRRTCGVMCVPKDEDDGQARKLERGDLVELQGILEYRVGNQLKESGQLEVKECRFSKVQTLKKK